MTRFLCSFLLSFCLYDLAYADDVGSRHNNAGAANPYPGHWYNHPNESPFYSGHQQAESSVQLSYDIAYPGHNPLILGIGQKKCSDFLKMKNKNDKLYVRGWVQGFMTGADLIVTSINNKSSVFNERNIIDEIENKFDSFCAAEPDINIAGIATKTYIAIFRH